MESQPLAPNSGHADNTLFTESFIGLSEALPQIVWFVNPDGAVEFVNQRWVEYSGLSRQASVGGGMRQTVHPADLPQAVAHWRQALQGKRPYEYELRMRRRDGRYCWHYCRIVPICGADGEISGWFGTASDIDKRKQQEQRLRFLVEAGAQLSASLDYTQTIQQLAELLAPGAVDWHDVDNVGRNPDMANYGANYGANLGSRFADWALVNLLRPDGRFELVAVAHREPQRVAQIWAFADEFSLSALASADAFETALAQAGGTPNVIRRGEALYCPLLGDDMFDQDARLASMRAWGLASLLIAPLEAHGHILGALTLARGDAKQVFSEADLHVAEELARRIALAVDNARLYEAARDAEAELQRLAATLEQRVAERTAELELANRELDQFAYVASHDLKAPLRAIENLSLWIEEDAEMVLPASTRTHLTMLRSRVQRMDRLLDDLLAFSRAGRIMYQPEVADVYALIKNVVELQGAPPGFTLEISAALPPVRTLRVPLETVLRNLIGNAIKHHHRPDGKIHIHVEAHGEQLRFCVSDDGPGIAPESHERIFEMFQTLQPRDRVEGSGIGLAIVKKIVESVGGALTVESAEGQGAAFCFTWPYTLVVAPD